MTRLGPSLVWSVLVLCACGGPSSEGSLDGGTHGDAMDAGSGGDPRDAGSGGDPRDAGEDTGPADTTMDAGPSCASAADGTRCGSESICLGGTCVVSACGDGFVDATGGEQCDDGNRTVGDGCDLDCRYDCTSDDDCVSDDRCVPLVCNDMHACEATAPVVCDDGDPCTIDGCERESGCVATPADRDGDGYLVEAFGTCELPVGDCDDDDAGRHPGAEERCEDGDAIDDDCDPATPSPRPSAWFSDCDGDGHPAAGADVQLGCAPPPAPPGCTGIGWTSTPTETTDCDDHNEDVFPGQTSGFAVPVPGIGGFDYDCDGVETKTSLCGGNCSINYSSGTCWISPLSTCTGACGSRSVRVTSCSDAVYCRNVYTNGLIGCR